MRGTILERYVRNWYYLSLGWGTGGPIRDELDIYFHLHASVLFECFVDNYISFFKYISKMF